MARKTYSEIRGGSDAAVAEKRQWELNLGPPRFWLEIPH